MERISTAEPAVFDELFQAQVTGRQWIAAKHPSHLVNARKMTMPTRI
jgi:hypothetical protein